VAGIALYGNFNEANLLFSSTCLEQEPTLRPHLGNRHDHQRQVIQIFILVKFRRFLKHHIFHTGCFELAKFREQHLQLLLTKDFFFCVYAFNQAVGE